jgi:hypothetical protein
MKIKLPNTMVQRRPNQSPAGPAKKEPKKAPPVKRETTTPLIAGKVG